MLPKASRKSITTFPKWNSFGLRFLCVMHPFWILLGFQFPLFCIASLLHPFCILFESFRHFSNIAAHESASRDPTSASGLFSIIGPLSHAFPYCWFCFLLKKNTQIQISKTNVPHLAKIGVPMGAPVNGCFCHRTQPRRSGSGKSPEP